MSSSRILSRHGNVIAADFKPPTSQKTTLSFTSETLYHDGIVMLMRTTARFGDRPLVVLHFLGDLVTGTIVQLTNG